MAQYTKQFVKPYPGGYVDKPQKTTPVTAAILNVHDRTFEALENFLTSSEVGFKALTLGARSSAKPVGIYSLFLGGNGTASGNGSVGIGDGVSAEGMSAVAMGRGSTATGDCSMASGMGAAASGMYAHAEGNATKATQMASHAEGTSTEASAMAAHAEGVATKATGGGAHAEGAGGEASGMNSHVEGAGCKARGSNSHAEGSGTIAEGAYQHVQGKYNIPDAEGKYAHIVGNGSQKVESGQVAESRSNAYTLDWDGNAKFAGDVTNGNGVSLNGLMELIGTTGQLRTIVDALPEDNISTNTIYMVPKESGSENDIYIEYINVDGTPEGWEFIGSSAIDLSNYYTRDQADQMLAGYVPAETGKGLSSNDYSDSDHALVESIRNMTTADALAILDETGGAA